MGETYLLSKSQHARDIGLPVSTVKHEHPNERAEEQPVGVSAQANGNGGANCHEH